MKEISVIFFELCAFLNTFYCERFCDLFQNEYRAAEDCSLFGGGPGDAAAGCCTAEF